MPRKKRNLCKIGTPLAVDILMRSHTQRTPIPNSDAPAVKEAMSWLVSKGVIKSCHAGDIYETTELGAAWVRAICNVTIPEIAYVDSGGRVL